MVVVFSVGVIVTSGSVALSSSCTLLRGESKESHSVQKIMAFRRTAQMPFPNPTVAQNKWLLIGLLMEIKSLCNQVENFIRVTVGPKYPKNAFKVAVSLTTKVS